MLHIVLADGFEEIEALATIDILRRCGLEVQIISVTERGLWLEPTIFPCRQIRYCVFLI